ncbi:hypothetical protein EYF80_027898 [Liparis tanakae]|uniref:Uncharacterized protein n=1 Tax=Liparis tanakae TaxID=230148 RepID=A0A4Z2HAR6_9TELE|nr:hypothetical protein EYF80_027898 [Liparis tanakae]
MSGIRLLRTGTKLIPESNTWITGLPAYSSCTAVWQTTSFTVSGSSRSSLRTSCSARERLLGDALDAIVCQIQNAEAVGNALKSSEVHRFDVVVGQVQLLKRVEDEKRKQYNGSSPVESYDEENLRLHSSLVSRAQGPRSDCLRALK